MTGLDGVNKKGLRKFYKENEAARWLLDHLARRERDWSSTSVDRMLSNIAQDGGDVSRGQLVEVMRELEGLGCGAFKVGRRGHASRFEWSVSLVSVGQFAAQEREDIEKLPDDASDETDSMANHVFNLRRGLPVSFSLPVDLTTAEAARLAKFIEALPMEP